MLGRGRAAGRPVRSSPGKSFFRGKHVPPENGRQQDCPGGPGAIPAGAPVPFPGYPVDYAASAEIRNL